MPPPHPGRKASKKIVSRTEHASFMSDLRENEIGAGESEKRERFEVKPSDSPLDLYGVPR